MCLGIKLACRGSAVRNTVRTLTQDLSNESGTLINTGKTVLGYVNMERKRPCRAPQKFIDELQNYFE